MTASDKLFAGSIPKLYDTLMVPMIFSGYAAHTAARVAGLLTGVPSPSVLETAAGSGVVTRSLAPMLPDDARYVVTDLNPPMLDFAAQRQPGDTRLEWRPADALALPFEEGQFDIVVCQFGAMFFPDRVAGYVEARRVLKLRGRLVMTVWDRIEDNAFADDVTQALAGLFPADPPRFLARTPHGYHDVAQIREDLRRAGFTHVEVTTREDMSRAPSAHAVATAYCEGTPLRNEIEARDAAAMPHAIELAAQTVARHRGAGVADKPVSGKIQAHLIVAGA